MKGVSAHAVGILAPHMVSSRNCDLLLALLHSPVTVRKLGNLLGDGVSDCRQIGRRASISIERPKR